MNGIWLATFLLFMVLTNSQGLKDKNKLCYAWAVRGECQKNPRYMIPNCPVSCAKCVALVDKHKSCRAWTIRGECKKNPRYMLVNCIKSCTCYKPPVAKPAVHTQLAVPVHTELTVPAPIVEYYTMPGITTISHTVHMINDKEQQEGNDIIGDETDQVVEDIMNSDDEIDDKQLNDNVAKPAVQVHLHQEISVKPVVKVSSHEQLAVPAHEGFVGKPVVIVSSHENLDVPAPKELPVYVHQELAVHDKEQQEGNDMIVDETDQFEEDFMNSEDEVDEDEPVDEPAKESADDDEEPDKE